MRTANALKDIASALLVLPVLMLTAVVVVGSGVVWLLVKYVGEWHDD